jgi:hypothetical protein
MGKFINHTKATEYLDGIQDPIVRALIENAYGRIYVEKLPLPDGDFDLLFLYRVLEGLLRDKERLARWLTEPLDLDSV